MRQATCNDDKPSYLFIIASSCQMYSGTGTAIYDWIKYSTGKYKFTMLMDSMHEVNFNHASDFCRRNDVTFISSPPFLLPGCPDSGIKRIADVLAETPYDIIECVSWANASTNLNILTNVPDQSLLLYTPHTQPLWTLGEPTRFPLVSQAFTRMIQRADAVFLDTPSEARLSLFDGHRQDNAVVVPLGVDVERFKDAGEHKANHLLCVCDCREPRKRIDLLLRAFELAHARKPKLTLTLAGKGSDLVRVPAGLETAITRLGYVPDGDLVNLYGECSLFVLLSDFEAFGLPIAEALCTGAAVLLNNQDATRELFAGEPGVDWVDNTDVEAAADLMCSIKTTKREHRKISSAAQKKFNFAATYGQKAEIVDSLLRGSVQ
jgi:glycosyltransferase involved in cell wall biosynthesis